MNYTAPSATEYKRKRPSKATLGAFDIFESFIRAIVLVFIIMTFFFRICTVDGASMNNTLYDGEKLIVQTIAYTPKEGDIIIFHQTGGILNEPIVKRLIATGDKWVRIDYENKTLYVSDDESFTSDDIIDESDYVFVSGGDYRAKGVFETYVPDGYLFVMGDNRNDSTDSRSSVIGLVDERRVLGKVVLRFSPLERFGAVD